MYWYILFVRTGRENKVERFLRERLDADTFIPFVPLQEYFFKTKGVVKKEVKPLFPSYVFIESGIPGQEFVRRIKDLVCTSRDIVFILRYSDTEIALRESEKQLLLNLCNDDYCIESSRGISEGNSIQITNGPLKGCEGIVKKVNRHKRLAWIEVELMGSTRLVSVALEVVSK